MTRGKGASERAQHTPGPWVEAVNMERGIFYQSYEIGTPETIIARTPTGIGGTFAANARLIAAAPAMLAALESVENWLREYIVQLGPDPMNQGMVAIHDKARAALALARP